MDEPIEAWEFINGPIGQALLRHAHNREARKLRSEIEAREHLISELEKRRKAIAEAVIGEDAPGHN